MSKNSVIALFTVAASMILGFAAEPASAMICCSACYGTATPPPMCKWGCSPTCADDDEPSQSAEGTAPQGLVYDDSAAMCYVSQGSGGCGSADAAAAL